MSGTWISRQEPKVVPDECTDHGVPRRDIPAPIHPASHPCQGVTSKQIPAAAEHINSKPCSGASKSLTGLRGAVSGTRSLT